MTMAKSVVQRIGKNKLIKRNKKKKFLKNFIDYLKSDCYLFAPLISPPPPSSLSPKIGGGIKESIRGKSKRLREKIEEYLKSDHYMYASLVEPPQSATIPSKGYVHYIKRVTMAASTMATKERDLTGQRTANIRTEDATSKAHPPEVVTPTQHTSVRKETVKRMIYQNCRTSVSGDSRIRKIAID